MKVFEDAKNRYMYMTLSTGNVQLGDVPGSWWWSVRSILCYMHRPLTHFPRSRRAPSLIVIDDLHQLCPHRDLSPGESERQAAAALCTCLDTLSQQPVDRPVVVMATTSVLDQVEPCLRRPGRFEKEIEVSVPTSGERVKVDLFVA